MKCQDVKDSLPLYSGGELPWWKRIRIKHHISRCEECYLEWRKLQKTREIVVYVLRQTERKILDKQLWKRVTYSFYQEEAGEIPTSKTVERRNKFIPRLVFPLIGLAMVLVLLFVKLEWKAIKLWHNQSAGKCLPVVQKVNRPNITVMTFQTTDPKVVIVWFFEEKPRS